MQVTLPQAEVICVYGLPDPELYRDLKEWLNENQDSYVIFLEEDEHSLLHFPIEHERIRVCYSENEAALKKLAWEFVFLKFEYLDTPGNSLKNPEKMKKLFAKLSFFQEGIHLVASDFKEKGIDRLHNYLHNAELMERAFLGQALFGKFRGVPALICGAGPSLEKEIPFLKQWQDRALIFAGGTTLSSLSALGVKPHFAGQIDPHVPSKRHFLFDTKEIPVFFQNRTHPRLLKESEKLLWIPGSENDLLEEEAFDGGWNVSTFLTSIAYHLGCNPIILVGVDLAQTKEKTYAGNLERPEEGELIALEEEGLYTRRDWLFAADWLMQFAKKHPEIEWINTSFEGLSIAGFERKSLQNLPLQPISDLPSVIEKAMTSLPKKSIDLAEIKKLKESFGRVGDLCSRILEIMEQLFPHSPEKNGEYALLQREIENEIAFEKFILPVWEIWKPVFARQMPKEIPPAFGIELNQWLFMQGICDDARKI